MAKEVTSGYRYFAGLHMVLCKGPVDALAAVKVGDRIAWQGGLAGNASTLIDVPNLFGGEEREGGVQGTLDVMMGGPTQAANDYLTAKQGGLQPGNRGVLSVVWRGGAVACNNPYLKPWAFRARRILAGWRGGTAWYPATAAIGLVASQQSAFLSDFGDPSNYTLQSGNGALFTYSSSPYGTSLDTASQNAATVAAIKRDVPTSQLVGYSAKFMVTAGANSDDATTILMSDAADAVKVGLCPRRETAFDSLRRPVLFHGATQITMGAAACTLNIWYQFNWTYSPTTGAYAATITEIDTGVQQSSVSGTTAGLGANCSRHRVVIDTGGPTCPVRYADIQAIASIAGLGMNPAHIIYQCLTDDTWGMGYDTSIINDTNFRAAADVFFAEGMGLCLHWTQQQPIQQFVQVVLDHAGAILAQDPTTGLFLLTPLRGGYDPSLLPVFDQTNVIRVESYEKPALTEAVNEIQVTYNDLVTAQKGSVKVQNLANITAQGGVVPKPVNYPGFAIPELAMRAAMRDLLAGSTPLARVRMVCNRSAYQLRSGSLIRLTWPKLSITTLVLRVLKVNYGSLSDGQIGIEAVEDVFGVPAATYGAQQPSGWASPNHAPTAATLRVVREATYFEVLRELGAADTAALAADASFVVAGAVRPVNDALDFALYDRVGTAAFDENGRGNFSPSGTISAQLEARATTATLTNLVDSNLIEAGTYAQLGTEIVRIDSFVASTGAITLGRGLHGTVAKTWAALTRLFVVDGYLAHDVVERVDAEVVNVRLGPRTGLGQLAAAAAPTDTITLDQLPARPYAPGALRINGLLYPPSVTSAIAATWAHRNRLQQNYEGDESGDIGPEASTTYNTWLRKSDGTIVESSTGITGTSWTPTTPTEAGNFILQVQAQVGSLVSGQMQSWPFRFEILTATATLIQGGAMGGTGQGGVAPGRLLRASASLIPGSATGGGPI